MVKIKVQCDSCNTDEEYKLEGVLFIAYTKGKTGIIRHDVDPTDAFKTLSAYITKEKFKQLSRN